MNFCMLKQRKSVRLSSRSARILHISFMHVDVNNFKDGGILSCSTELGLVTTRRDPDGRSTKGY